MPFRKAARITMENLDEQDMTLYYQIDYTLTDVPADAAYFHAQFRRSNPLPYKTDYTILDGVKGWGHYVGTYLAWGVNNTGWWGEGEIKFFMDGDTKFPTICGTGTEDYFCGSYNFENPDTKQYQEFTTPYAGLPQVMRPDGVYNSQQRFGLYRWHIMDPIRFETDLRVTIQALGWRSGRPLPAAAGRHRVDRRSGTRPNRTRRSRSCPAGTRSKSGRLGEANPKGPVHERSNLLAHHPRARHRRRRVVGGLGAQSKGKAVSGPTAIRVDGNIIKGYIAYMASDDKEGRRSLTPGYEKVAEWAAGKFKEWGLKPAGDNGTFLQDVPITGGFTWTTGIPELTVDGRVFYLKDGDFTLDQRSTTGHPGLRRDRLRRLRDLRARQGARRVRRPGREGQDRDRAQGRAEGRPRRARDVRSDGRRAEGDRALDRRGEGPGQDQDGLRQGRGRHPAVRAGEALAGAGLRVRPAGDPGSADGHARAAAASPASP